MMRGCPRFVAVPFVLSVLVLASACDDSAGPADRIVEGVDLDLLFAEPSPAEIDAIADEWEARDVSVQSVQEVVTSAETIGEVSATLRIVSHDVGGMTHYGAILVPDGAAPGSLPVLVYTHGGDGGVDIDELLPLLPVLLGEMVADFVLVAPAFRSEPLVFDGAEYLSEGAPSPWDLDVDDALALLNVALETAPEADPERIAVVGFSRGACVAMLMAERDSRIDLVVEFHGPTDFFGPFVQEVVEEALRGTPRDLPGLAYLDTTFIQPLKDGELTIEDVRPELVRRSPVYFAELLPQLQVHHGTADETVPVGEAQRLIEVMQGLGRGEPEFEFYLYEGGTHNPLTLSGSIPRTRDFLSRLLPGAVTAR
ncbi:MAG: dienelactone hydrolase family protein [Gemmatimonadota bacterium]|nr:MAG: dienelactone hydrolase family protein [Gemmatimonadota bacterium]